MPRAGVSVGRTEWSAAAPAESPRDERWLEDPSPEPVPRLRPVPERPEPDPGDRRDRASRLELDRPGRLDPAILELWDRKVAGTLDHEVAGRSRADGGRRSNAVLDPPRQRESVDIGGAVATRRTVTIQGRGAERDLPRSRRRPQRPLHERNGFRPDRTALYAVLLGLFLILAAATSARAAGTSPPPRAAITHQLTVTVDGGAGPRALP